MRIGVDTFGLPHVMFVSTANVTDCEGAVTMIGYAVPICQGVKLFWLM
ncbi:MAG: hypothetical protein LBC12_00985 [Nitrososphaerota archaeon]|nr:hypothetical protein [Nitrososphaerota archaeon]